MTAELYQVVVGRRSLPLRSCLLRGGGEENVDFTYSMWIIVDGAAVTLVDTGFSGDVAARRGIAFERTALEAVREFDIEPADVAGIVLSHLHFDHAGGLADFPSAKVYLQRSDLDFYTGEFMRFPLCSSAAESDDIAEVERIRSEGRLELLAGDAEIVDGVRVFHLGGHTPGMQAVEVVGADLSVVLASDAAHLYANLEKRVPFPVLHDVPTSCVAFERLDQLANAGAAVVPGHDGAVMDRFERVPGRRSEFATRLC